LRPLSEPKYIPPSILVVEDDDGQRDVMSTVLRRRGYRVLELARGEDALEVAQEELPDLVLLDIRLPGMSGYDVCRELRAEFGPRLPIVFISGVRTEPYDEVAGLRLGADDYIVKPFAVDELVARIDRLLERADPDRRPEPADDDSFGLTRRELEVLRLLAEGIPAKKIAPKLSVTEKTVSSHIQNILAKLEVHSQAQAVSVAFTAGLINPPYVSRVEREASSAQGSRPRPIRP
jgi:DNA-binding NarL/FixJ family response regulator